MEVIATDNEKVFYLQEHPADEISKLSSQYLKMFMDLLTGKFKYTYDKNVSYRNLDMVSFETSLNFEGQALLAMTEDGVMAIPWSYQYGVSPTSNQPFYHRFTDAGFANPVLRSKQNLTIGENCVVCYNTPSTWQPIITLADMADTMAHIDLSLKIAVINGRMTGVFEVENDNQKTAVEDFYAKIRVGKPAVITGSHMMSHVNYLPQVDSKAQTITELINARNNVLRYALRFCSLKISKDKAEAVLSNESEDEQSFLDANIEYMLNNRREACRQATEIFEQSIRVDIADYLSRYSQVGGNTDGNSKKKNATIEEVVQNNQEGELEEVQEHSEENGVSEDNSEGEQESQEDAISEDDTELFPDEDREEQQEEAETDDTVESDIEVKEEIEDVTVIVSVSMPEDNYKRDNPRID